MPELRCSSVTILSLSLEMEQSSWIKKDPRKKLTTTWIFKQKKTTSERIEPRVWLLLSSFTLASTLGASK
jgi:hypothetical protein